MASSPPIASLDSPGATQRRRGRSRWLGTAALLGAIFLLYEMTAESGFMARREQQERIQTLSRQVEDLQQENLRLSQDIQNLRSDPAAIEEMAREQLHLARPGEVVVTLPSAR